MLLPRTVATGGDQVTDDLRVERIREGRRTPVEERQARYDTFRAWSEVDKLSLAQIAARWEAQTGQPIARQRVSTILSSPRPGTFFKGSQLVALERKRDDLREKIKTWTRRQSPVAVQRVADLQAQLVSVEADLREERKSARKLSRVTA
jgi:hypothetical protein